MPRPYDPELVEKLQTSAAWSAVTRSGLGPDAAAVLGTWDGDLLREPRVLVPVDVQALVVGPDDPVDVVALPGPLTPGAPDDPATLDGPDPFTEPGPAPPGVHLHWAMPDALLSGVLRDPRGRTGGGLDLPALPDRWAVLRLLAAAKDADVHVRGWLVDAAAGVVRDLADGPEGRPLGPTAQGRAVLAPAELTGAAGGSLTWTAGYHAAAGRFAVHDPLDDLAADPTLGGALPGGPESGLATYLVVGWWSKPELDPLDGVRTEGGLDERSAALGWRIAEGGGGSNPLQPALDRLAGLGPAVGRRVSVAAAAAGLSVHAASVIDGAAAAPEASTLLHGAAVGVPVTAVPRGAVDLQPGRDGVAVAFGEHNDDLVAAVVAPALAPGGGPDERRAVERLLTAFTGRLLPHLGTADGLVAIEEREHARGFAALDSGDPPVVDRTVAKGGQIPPRPPRPGGRRTTDLNGLTFSDVPFSATTLGLLVTEPAAVTLGKLGRSTGPFAPFAAPRAGAPFTSPPPTTPSGFPTQAPTPPPPPAEATLTERPAPPRHVPLDPVLAVSGAGRSLRHGGDGRGSADGRLRCRRGSQVVTGYRGVVRGADLVGSLGSGALPAETLALAREALLLSPYLGEWLARFATSSASTVRAADAVPARRRLLSELALRYDATGAYTGIGALQAFTGAGGVLGPAAVGDRDAVAVAVQELLRRHSLLEGVEPDIVAITAWAQPWVPMWVEWEVGVDVVDAATGTRGWRLGQLDLEPADEGPARPAATRSVTGRAPLSTAPGEALAGGVTRWMIEENARDAAGRGEAEPDLQERIAALGRAADAPDLMGAALDGIRRALLGLPSSTVRARAEDGSAAPPAPVRLPDLIAAGTVVLRRARLVDAFGRVLELDTERALVPSRLAVPDAPATLARSPRFVAPARCALRFVDAATAAAGAAVDARVDELDPAAQVSPVCGFLLSDHVDESMEVFDAAGDAVGELTTEPLGGGVVWEAAAGRPLPADAPPGAGLAPAAAALGFIAAGIVTADAAARAGRPAAAATPSESALSALLRAIDTTLWTAEPIAGTGSTATGSIVGRPVAVVRAVLGLDVADDLDDLTLDDAARAARAQAYRELAAVEVPVRIGELTRADDGVLGWFVDDDFSRLHVVDRVVRELARQAGRRRGHLAPRGETPQVPDPEPITHPYLLGDDELVLRPGVPRLLTLLMLPGLAAHVTNGVTPRSAVRLARAWFATGLERLVPSIRVGPVLVDPGEVRLPLVAALGSTQRLTTREGPLGWRDDPILAATQGAVLPDRAAVLREGWIRVDPQPPQGSS